MAFLFAYLEKLLYLWVDFGDVYAEKLAYVKKILPLQRQNEFMQPIDFADILSTELQLAHTGYLTHALCLQGTATLLFNGAEFPLHR